MNFLTKIKDIESGGAYDFMDLQNVDSPYVTNSFSTQYIHEIDIPNNEDYQKKNFALSINIQSLQAKFTNLNELLKNFDKNLPVMIFLQEIWKIDNEEILKIHGYFSPFFTTRDGKGGGVGLYIRDDLKVTTINTPFHPRVFESQAAEVTFSNGKKITIVNLYRPNTVPSNLTVSQQNELFFDYLANVMENLNNDYENVLIGGDFNYNLLNIGNDNNTRNYLNLTFANGYLQTVLRPTRVQNQSATLIDHFLTNIHQYHYKTSIIVSDLSDHFPVAYFFEDSQLKRPKPKKIYTRNLTDENIQSFKELLLQLSWVEVINEQNCSKAYDEFLNTFFFYYNSYFPLIERNFNINYHKKEQWQTLGLLTSRRNKNRLQKLFYDKRTPQAQIQYRNYRNIYNKLVREAKKAYYEELIENNSGNPKKCGEF